MFEMLKNRFLLASLKDIVNDEEGDTNFISIVIILIIVIVVAIAFIAFKDKILALFTDRTQKLEDVL